MNKAKAGATCLANNSKKNSVKDIDYGYYLGVGAPKPGTDIVMYNDINPFDNTGMTNANNPLMVANRVDFTTAGPRGSGTVVWFDRGRSSVCGGTGECSDASLASMESAINGAGYTITEINSTSGSITSIPADVKTDFLFLYDSTNTQVLAGVAKIDITPLSIDFAAAPRAEIPAQVEREGLNPLRPPAVDGEWVRPACTSGRTSRRI